MYKLGAYNQNNRMSDLVCDNYPVLLVMSRFGIALGFGDKSIGEFVGKMAYIPKHFWT